MLPERQMKANPKKPPQKKPLKKLPAKLPKAIKSPKGLAAHLDALCAIAPEFKKVRTAAGVFSLRWLQPGYAGLVWVVMGQQISVSAAKAIMARLETSLGTVTPETVMAATDEELRAPGLSRQKIATLRSSALAVQQGLDLDALKDLEAEEAIATLCAVKGIGRWTAEVYLLFALGHPDIFPAGDLAIQESARLAFALDARPKEKELLSRAEAWRPHRAAAARLLWAYYVVARSGRDATPV
jgi:DNA-3-methyladenine glycosylase II